MWHSAAFWGPHPEDVLSWRCITNFTFRRQRMDITRALSTILMVKLVSYSQGLSHLKPAPERGQLTPPPAPFISGMQCWMLWQCPERGCEKQPGNEVFDHGLPTSQGLLLWLPGLQAGDKWAKCACSQLGWQLDQQRCPNRIYLIALNRHL